MDHGLNSILFMHVWMKEPYLGSSFLPQNHADAGDLSPEASLFIPSGLQLIFYNTSEQGQGGSGTASLLGLCHQLLGLLSPGFDKESHASSALPPHYHVHHSQEGRQQDGRLLTAPSPGRLTTLTLDFTSVKWGNSSSLVGIVGHIDKDLVQRVPRKIFITKIL